MKVVPRSEAAHRSLAKRVLAVLRLHPQLTFTSLAGAIPDYTWHALFKALSQLQEQQQITLSPLPWDYEILLHSSLKANQRKDLRRAHD